MARLIDADELKGLYDPANYEGHEPNENWDDVPRTFALIRADIDDQPTVDAVSVVRCKDCKYMADGKCCVTTKSKAPDDCCSFGEKMTKHGMKKFFVLSRRSPEYHRIVEAEDISEIADHYYDSCYGIIEISQDEVTNNGKTN